MLHWNATARLLLSALILVPFSQALRNIKAAEKEERREKKSALELK